MFGVLLWEMFSQGEVPYKELTPVEVAIAVVAEGARLAQPRRCPAPLYATMQRCWASDPAARPPMVDIVALLTQLYDQPIVDDASES